MTITGTLIGNAWQLLPEDVISDYMAKAFSIEFGALLILLFIDTSLGKPEL